MKVKNLVVADIIYPTTITRTTEMCNVKTNNILKKLDNGLYENVENGKHYRTIHRRGFSRIDEDSIIPLSDYYYKIGLKKKNDHKNKENVYKKVKELKKNNFKL
ncbi:MAG: hypothetical protein E7160_03145 [Firmicutes bacterium]|nr:hypothetical protein [Bacillota bacterium]